MPTELNCCFDCIYFSDLYQEFEYLPNGDKVLVERGRCNKTNLRTTPSYPSYNCYHYKSKNHQETFEEFLINKGYIKEGG